MVCPECHRFPQIDWDSEPEVDLEISATGKITASVRIMNACADCGTELKEGNMDVEVDVDLSKHQGEGHSVSVEAADAERTMKTEGKGRGLKTFYGFSLKAEVSCSCQKDPIHTDHIEDYIQASSMDELI